MMLKTIKAVFSFLRPRLGGDGGGGDNSYAAEQAAQEAKKAEARAAINRQFGVGGGAESVNRASYMSPGTTTLVSGPQDEGIGSWYETSAPVFNQADYISAIARDGSEASANMAAREKAYGDVRNSVLDLNTAKLDEDRIEANRMLKFALLRSGNSGGSLDIDEHGKAQKAFDRGIFDATNMADSSATSARTSDERARLDLLSRVDAGMDQGSALASAANQLQSSTDTALQNAKGSLVGNVFDNAGLLYSANQVGQGNADAISQFFALKNQKVLPGQATGGYSGTSVKT